MATCNLSASNYLHQIIRPHIAVPLLQLANGSQGMLPHSDNSTCVQIKVVASRGKVFDAEANAMVVTKLCDGSALDEGMNRKLVRAVYKHNALGADGAKIRVYSPESGLRDQIRVAAHHYEVF